MKLTQTFGVMICVLACSAAQDLTTSDRDRGIRYLEETRHGVMEATKGLSEAQWKFQPAPDRWSVAEVVEHLALAEDFLMHTMREQFPKAPAAAADRNSRQTDALILSKLPDRSVKFQAPPPLVPTGRWTPAGALEHFLAARAQTAVFLKSTPDLRGHVVDLPPLGQPVDGFEWILAVSAHSERHTKQILEVKADPNFPAN